VRIILFVIVITILLLIYSNESITPRIKAAFSILLVLLVATGYFYEKDVEKKEALNMKKLEAFMQNRDLVCTGGVIVNNKTFSYLSGTMTFSPKPENVKDRGLIISINDCAIKKR